MNENRKIIGERIKKLRKKNKLTQLELAEKCGLKQQAIQSIEKGKFSTGIDILSKISKALDCKIDFVENNSF